MSMDVLMVAGAALFGLGCAVLVFKVESLERRVDALEKSRRQ